MKQVPQEILLYLREPAILALGGKVSFANTEARKVLGTNCVGKTVKSLFGANIAGAQAASFIANVIIDSKQYIVRALRSTGGQTIIFSPSASVPFLVNDAFLYPLKNSLMNMSMCADRSREHAQLLGNDHILSNIASFNRSYHSVLRMIYNASILQGLSDGSLPFCAKTINLSALCVSLAEKVSLLSDAKFNLDLGDDIAVFAEPALIEQLLLNLISNCMVHATGYSGISIRLTETADSVIISVGDDGCGIAPENLSFAFDRYLEGFDAFRGSSGFGMVVVRQIAEKHGGTVLLESSPGSGTTVRVTLSKNSGFEISMYSSEQEYSGSTKMILTQLADCLPDKHYGNLKTQA